MGFVDPTPPGVDAAADVVPETGVPEPVECAPSDEAAVVVPSLEGTNYTISLESAKLSRYEGLVRANEFYGDHAPLICDIVVCNGDYENPDIEVGLSGHHYSWSYQDPADEPKTGYIVNVHAVPSTKELSDRIKAQVKKGVRIRVWGFEVDKVNYDDGSWWTDAGCNTLLITHVCVE